MSGILNASATLQQSHASTGWLRKGERKREWGRERKERERERGEKKKEVSVLG